MVNDEVDELSPTPGMAVLVVKHPLFCLNMNDKPRLLNAMKDVDNWLITDIGRPMLIKK